MSARGGMSQLEARAMAGAIPLRAQIELTGRCHMDCIHCYLDVKRPPKDELSTAEVVDVLDQLAAAGSMFLTLTGGEIFLRDDVLAIVDAAVERQFSVRLFTSGTLIDRAMVRELAARDLECVEISVYGMRSRIHDAITRRRGSLRRSLRAAVALSRAGVRVIIKSPLITGSAEAHFDLIDAARRIGCGYKIEPSLITRRDGGTEPIAARPPIHEVARMFADPRVAPIPDQLPDPVAPDEPPCSIGRSVVRIAPNGDVHACTAFPISAGNLRDASFDDIWRRSPVLAEIRSFTTGDLEGECAGCSRQGYCGRCSALALLEHGNFRGPTAEACDRAEAQELSRGVAPPAGARRIAHATPLGQRDFVPLRALSVRANQ